MDFSCSTGNSTNDSDATIQQHTLRDEALKNIDLVDKNYALENDLLDTQDQMTALLPQNLLLQETGLHPVWYGILWYCCKNYFSIVQHLLHNILSNYIVP
jgi:hypothetical protein